MLIRGSGPRLVALSWRAACLVSILPGLCGCYAAAVGIVVGALELSSGSSSGASNDPPLSPLVEPPERCNGDYVLITYFLADDDDGPLDVMVEWRAVSSPGAPLDPPQAAWSRATEHDEPLASRWHGLLQSHGTTGLWTERETQRRTVFLWRARSDLQARLGTNTAHAEVRITAREGARSSLPGASPVFIAGNDPPAILTLEQKAASGVIPLEMTFSDSTSDPVTVAATYRVGLKGEPKCMTLVGDLSTCMPRQGNAQSTGFETAPDEEGGLIESIFWDSLADLGNQASKEIYVEIVPDDSLEIGLGTGVFGPLEIDNNSDPVVVIEPVANSPDKSFEIPIRFLLRDEEESPATVVLQWAVENEGFPKLIDGTGRAIPLESPSAEQLQYLRDLLASDPGEGLAERRRELRILSEASALVRGSVDAAPSPPLLDRVRATDLVRRGLVFVPPALSGPRPLPGHLDASSGLFARGKRIRLSGGPEDPGVWRRIEAFDPRRSEITLDEPLDAPLSPGSSYEIDARGGLVGLASSTEGLYHSFVWDSLADIRSAGVPLDAAVKIRAVAFDSQGAESTPVFFKLESGYLSRARTLTTGAAPIAVVAGDVNHDGLVDALVLNESARTVDIFLQDPFRFVLPRTASHTLELQASSIPSTLVLGDLSGDGRTDLVVAFDWDSNSPGRLQVFWQRRDPGASPPFSRTADQVFELPGAEIPSLQVGDLDGKDGDDLVAAIASGNSLRVFYQEEGKLIEGPSLDTRPGSRPESVAVGYLNDDDHLDVLAAAFYTGEVLVFLQDDLGRLPLEPSGKLPTGGDGSPTVVAGDVTGDGRDDVLVAYKLSSTVGFHEQLPPTQPGADLRFAEQVILPAGASPVGLAVGDISGEGQNDLLVVNQRAETLTVFLQDDLGALPAEPSQTLVTDSRPSSVAVGDFNNDGRSDTVVTGSTSDTIAVFLHSSPAWLHSTSTESLPSALPVAAVIGDLNADGRTDLAVADQSSGTVGVHLQGVSGAIPTLPNEILHAGDKPRSLAIGDVDGDGRNDLATANSGAGTISVFLQRDGGLFEPLVPDLGSGQDPVSVAIDDLDADGLNDLVTVCGKTTILTIYHQDRDGRLILRPDALESGSIPAGADRVATGDLNGDGRADLAVLRNRENVLLIHHQEAAGGGFAPAQSFLGQPEHPGTSIAVGDLNSDGREDLAVVGVLRVTLFLQTSSGHLEPLDFLVQGTLAVPDPECAIGDVDGDGKRDFILHLQFSGPESESVHVFLQDPTESLPFQCQSQVPCRPRLFLHLPSDSGVKAVSIGDLSGDGRNDVVFTNGNRTTSVFLAR